MESLQSRLVSSINRNVLQYFLPAIRSISSELFIIQQDSAPAHKALEVRGNQLFPITMPKVQRLKICQNRLSNKFVTKCWSNVPPHLNHVATLRCDVSLIIILYVSGCCFFSDINILQQGSVATRLRYGEKFWYCLVTNLLLSLLVKEFWKSVSIWQS